VIDIDRKFLKDWGYGYPVKGWEGQKYLKNKSVPFCLLLFDKIMAEFGVCFLFTEGVTWR